jgi:DUF1365 family protein
MTKLNSHLAIGTVRHRRFTPKKHQSFYPVFMNWLDLTESLHKAAGGQKSVLTG